MATQEEILEVIKNYPKGIRQSELSSQFNLPQKSLNKQILKLARKGLIVRQILFESGRPYKIFPLRSQFE